MSEIKMLKRKIELIENRYVNILTEIEGEKSEMRQKEVEVQTLTAEIEANRERYADALMENERMFIDYYSQITEISKKLEAKRVGRRTIVDDDYHFLQNSKQDLQAKIQQIGENLKPLEVEHNNLIERRIRTRESIVTVDESILSAKVYDPSSGVFEEQTIPQHMQATMTFSEWIAFYKDKRNTLQNYMIEQRSNELDGLFN